MSERTAWIVVLVGLVLVLSLGGVELIQESARAAFMRSISNEVERRLSELRPDLSDTERANAGRLLAALAAHETGYGRTPAWRHGFNFGNVTAGTSWTGAILIGPDTEYDAAGNVRDISQRFRRYGSLSEAVSDWLVGVLNWRRERQERVADRLYAGDAEGFVRALSRAGYFTQPVDDYLAAVNAALEGEAIA